MVQRFSCKSHKDWVAPSLQAVRHSGCCVIEDVLSRGFLDETAEALYRVREMIVSEIGHDRIDRAGEIGVLRLMQLYDPHFFKFLEIPEALTLIDRTVSPTAIQQIESVNSVLRELGCDDVPRLTLLNKTDLPCDADLLEMLETKERGAMRVSAKTGAGLDALVQRVEQQANRDMVDVTICVPQAEGKLLSELDHHAEIAERRFVGNDVELDIRVNRAHLAQFRSRCPSITVVRGDPDPKEDWESIGRAG